MIRSDDAVEMVDGVKLQHAAQVRAELAAAEAEATELERRLTFERGELRFAGRVVTLLEAQAELAEWEHAHRQAEGRHRANSRALMQKGLNSQQQQQALLKQHNLAVGERERSLRTRQAQAANKLARTEVAITEAKAQLEAERALAARLEASMDVVAASSGLGAKEVVAAAGRAQQARSAAFQRLFDETRAELTAAGRKVLAVPADAALEEATALGVPVDAWKEYLTTVLLGGLRRVAVGASYS